MFNPHRLVCTLVVLVFCALPASSIVQNVASAQSPPTAAEEFRDRGIDLYRQGKSEEAIGPLKATVRIAKTDPQAWYFLGLAQTRLGEFEDASKSLNNAVKLRPDFAPAHLALAYVALQRNRQTEALREAEAVLAIEPASAEAHFIIGVAHLRAGKQELALRKAEAAIGFNPDFAPPYLLKSQALVGFVGYAPLSSLTESTDVRKDRFVEAANALERYLQLEPHAKDKQTWVEQLNSLTFHASSPDKRKVGGERVYSGKEVTTKARVLSKPEPQLNDTARRRGTDGVVILRGILAADGTVKHLLILQGLPNGLTESALAAARRIKFNPATLNGKAVSMYIQLEYNFYLF